MKRFALILFTFIICSISVIAHDSTQVYFYGIDFSEVKVIAADESEHDFAEAFSAINLLMLTEKEKYDFSKVLEQQVIPYPDVMIEQSRINDYSKMKLYRYQREDIDLLGKIKSYKLSHDSGIGLMLIACVLDKSTGLATYEAVLFDIETRELLNNNRVTAKAGGFGLRNYWARTVYNLTLRETLF